MIRVAPLATACGASIGLIEAARALLALPHVTRHEGIVIAVASVLGHGALAGIAAFLVDCARRRRRGSAASDRIHDAAWATGVAVATLVGVLRARVIIGSGLPELAHLLTGPLLEALAAGALAGIAASRVRRRWLLFCWAIAGTAAALVVAAVGLGEARRAKRFVDGPSDDAPNVVLVSVDTLRPDHIGAYGRRPSFTPNLDRLANQATVFETVRSAAPHTGPSHTTMLTGLYPARHGARVNGAHLRDDVETLPGVLARRGYRTAAFVSGWTMTNHATGLGRRFDYYDDDLSAGALLPDAAMRVPLVWLGDRTRLWLVQRGRSVGIDRRFRAPAKERAGSRTVDRARRWLERHRNERFFLFVHFFDPHAPYEPAAVYRELVDPGYAGDLARYDPVDERRSPRPPPSAPQIARIRNLYEAEVSATDAAVGRLLAALAELALVDRTVVVFTADHGEGLGEHGEYFQHDFVYETTMRVPLIIRRPGGSGATTRIAAAIHLVDLAPTILSLTGGRFASDIDGVSQRPRLDGGHEQEERTVFGASEEGGPFSTSHHYVVDAGLKLIWTLDMRWQLSRQPAYEELFDLVADPRELDNLAPRAELAGERERLRTLLRHAIESREIVRETELDAEARRRLHSLGYL